MKKIVYILLTSIFILTGYFSINRLIVKPDLPFDYNSNKSEIYLEISSAQKGINKLISIDGFEINNEFQLEFFLDRKQVGDNVKILYYEDSGEIVNDKIILTPYYHNLTFIIVSGFIGYVFLLMALFVILKKPDSKPGLFLYWILILYGTATLTSPGQYSMNGDIIGYIIRTLHAVSYSAGGLLFVLFILSFPVDRLKERKANIITLTVLTLIVALFASIAQINSINNIKDVGFFDKSWTIVLALLVISLAYGTIELVKTFSSLTRREDKRKTEWIIWGLVVGVSPYIIIWVIPDIFNIPKFIKEEYLLAFLIFVPVSFAIAVVKYHVFDIELVIKRSVVYSTLLVLITIMYFGVVYLVTHAAGELTGARQGIFNLIVLILIALLFNPLRIRINRFVDTVFYREKYVFNKVIIDLSVKIKECITLGDLGKMLAKEIDKLIPVSAIAVVVRTPDGERLRILQQKSFEELTKYILALRVNQLKSDFTLPLALENKVEKDLKIDTSMEQVLKRWDINVAIPLALESYEALGAIVMGGKLSGLKYSISDIELLSTIASNAALAVKKLELQEKLFAEEIELTKLEELNRLKSFYVASVSHDLKTPLTSIKVFTELMQSEKRIPVEKRNEYLKIIEGETDRLSRLIDNVLDFAKIEKGIKQYSFTGVDLNSVLKSVIKAVQYTLQINKFKLHIKYSADPAKINGDPDAIKSALFNIINNSIKYSENTKCINIMSGVQDGSAFIEIEDKGIGIQESDQKFIFDPFFRSVSNEIKGAGLGLAIVKYVMDAHKGKIELVSKINSGTRIRLIFPMSKNE